MHLLAGVWERRRGRSLARSSALASRYISFSAPFFLVFFLFFTTTDLRGLVTRRYYARHSRAGRSRKLRLSPYRLELFLAMRSRDSTLAQVGSRRATRERALGNFSRLLFCFYFFLFSQKSNENSVSRYTQLQKLPGQFPRSKLPDRKIAKNFLPGVSVSNWSRVVNVDYSKGR